MLTTLPNAFASPERNNFYYNSKLPFWDARLGIGKYTVPRPYALYTCYQVPKELIGNIQNASVLAAQVITNTGKLLANESYQEMEALGYRKDLQRFLQLPSEDIFCMRIAWSVFENKLKLIETNTERPVFWIETEEVNGEIAEHFGLENPTTGTEKILSEALDQAIERAFKLHRPDFDKKPEIGYVVPNSSADYQTLQWLCNKSVFGGEVLTIYNIDFDKKNHRPFNRATGKYFDALFCWYPIEEMSEIAFKNGEKFDKVFLNALKMKSFILIHELDALRLQPKSVLAYITKNKDKIFKGDLALAEKYFPETYLEPNKLGDSYFTKPIWGRGGHGCKAVDGGNTSYGRFQESYYNKQTKVYQELLSFPTLNIDDKSLSLVYEAWVYNVNNKWVPGAVGIRASENTITDSYSYFLPIGIKKSSGLN